MDASHEKEARNKKTVTTLKEEIAKLTKLVEEGGGLSMGQKHRYVTCVTTESSGS